ncbi:MAG TPA: N-acetyl-gamma-glutamyl-phosphate reductase [Planctomycetota bacterium]|nr:N-acetyl-gamma-glutamyl-phosphate reductase [Planctomycetota bacterium]
MGSLRIGIAGGSGFAGGELQRLLHSHPEAEVVQVSSERFAGKPVTRLHPNLRRLSKLCFVPISWMEPVDLMFLCLPHGAASQRIEQFAALAPRIIDLSADFRLRSPEAYRLWYGEDHPAPHLLGTFVYGIPELHREEMRGATRISSAGCNATASILALYPLYREGVVHPEQTVIEVKVGSSEGGNSASESSHHPTRSGCVRSFMPTNHRHTGEIVQELDGIGPLDRLHFSATSIDMVRGVLATCHVFLKEDLPEKEIWKIYRRHFADEPFLRVVKEREGSYRYPEPKLLSGTNFCDVGFERDPGTNRLVVISAIDNLMKGAAGQAVQAMNLMMGFEECMGLDFPGLHPI